MSKEDFVNKLVQICERIVEGWVVKWLGEFVLLEQFFIWDDKVFVKDFVKELIV